MVLDDRVKGLLDGRPFAVLATLNPDGTPQTSVIWAARDGDVLVFTTHDQRQKSTESDPGPAGVSDRVRRGRPVPHRGHPGHRRTGQRSRPPPVGRADPPLSRSGPAA